MPGAGDKRVLQRLAQMPALRVIQTLSAGVDWLLPFLPDGVLLCDAGGTRDTTVAEWVLAVILASSRSLPELRDAQREHRWEWLRSRELAGSTVLILGYGSIGAAVEARLAPFDVEVIRVARHARPGVHAVDELASLLARADTLVVLLPLTSQTKDLLDAEMLARLPQGALLVNAARGPIVDTEALLALLRCRAPERSAGRDRSRAVARRSSPVGRARDARSPPTSPETAWPPSGAPLSSSANRCAAMPGASRWRTSSRTATSHARPGGPPPRISRTSRRGARRG